jgi:hypothetical protein
MRIRIMNNRTSFLQSGLLPSISIIMLAGFLFASCGHGTAWENAIDWSDLDFRALPGVEQYPDVGAVVLLDEGKMEIFGSGEVSQSVFERHRIVKVLAPSGQQYANVVIPYASGSQVDGIQGRAIGPDGTITVVQESDIFDVSLYPNYIFFSDQRAKLFTLPAVEMGTVLEYRYRLRVSGHTLWHSWEFQDRVPTRVSRFTLLSPAEYPVTPKLYGISIEPKRVKVPAGFKATTVWEARDVPPLEPEFGMPAEREVEARLAIAPLGFRSWDDVAKWYGDLAGARESAGPRIKALAARLTADAPDDRTRLKKIFEWVQQHVRYMAVEIGIGGYQPHHAEEVCSKLYGDCKDMTTLLCSIAREAGIDVKQALVSTWQNGRPDTGLASPLQFNHVIAYCPSVDGGTWMDPTEKWCRFGELPWYDQGLPVMVVEGKAKGKIVTTPRTAAVENRSIDEWEVRLESSGAALIRGTSSFKGMPAIEQRNDIGDLKPSDRRRWLESYLATRCPGAILDSFRVEGLRPVGDSLEIRYTFRTAMFGVPNSSGMVLHPGWASGSGLSDYFRSPSRVQPLRFRFGLNTELGLAVHLPPGWAVSTPMSSDSLATPFGRAYWTCSVNGSTLTVRSGHTFLGEEIAASEYLKFQEFLDEMQRRDARVIDVRLLSTP